LFCAAEKGGFVELQVEVSQPGRYALAIDFTRAPDFGIVEVSLGGSKLGERFDGYSPAVIPSGEVAFGAVELSQGKHRIRFTAVDRNAKATNYFMGIDRLKLKPVE